MQSAGDLALKAIGWLTWPAKIGRNGEEASEEKIEENIFGEKLMTKENQLGEKRMKESEENTALYY
jgi:hypothetical protein